MNRKITSIMLVAALVLLAVAGVGCQQLKARDELNKGVRAFSSGNYPTAVEHFKLAISYDSKYPLARTYLGTAYQMQYIPGAESEENLRMAQAAEEEFMNVLGQDPNNIGVMTRLAKLYFDQKKFDQSWQWYKKLISVDPNYKDAHYTLGVIAWTKTFQPRMDARFKMGMKSDDPGPLKDKKVLAELRAQNLPIIQEGMEHLKKALEIQPDYDDAMSYLNLLYRERADLALSPEEYKKDWATADDWIDRTLQTKKEKQNKAAAKSGGGLTTSQ